MVSRLFCGHYHELSDWHFKSTRPANLHAAVCRKYGVHRDRCVPFEVASSEIENGANTASGLAADTIDGTDTLFYPRLKNIPNSSRQA
jgi:hypothetical protein